jgi:hypothetical protein
VGDPFGGAVFAFSGGPAAGFDQGVIGAAGQGQGVDVGAMGGGPLLDVVDLAFVAGHVATGAGAAAVVGMKVLVMHPRYDARSAGRILPGAHLTSTNATSCNIRAIRARRP